MVVTVFWGGIVDFDSFQKVLNRPGGFREPGEPEEYCRGFQVFDKDMTGFIGVGQLRYSEFLPPPLWIQRSVVEGFGLRGPEKWARWKEDFVMGGLEG